MKSIDLVKVKEKIVVNGTPTEIELSTLDLLETVINSPKQGGFSVAEMATRIRLLENVKAVKDTQEKGETVVTISFEDADFKSLAELVKEMKWAIISKTIIEFCKVFDK